MNTLINTLKTILSPFQYGEPKLNDDGYWGPVTSTIDWCEENYVISKYFAEIINSTTNLLFFKLSFDLLKSSIINKHGIIFIFCSIGMFTVGVGSFLFHMTLRYEFQLMDELSMIYVTALPFAYIYSIELKSTLYKTLIYLITSIVIIILTLIYCSIYKNPALHQISYGILNFLIIFKSLNLIKNYIKLKKDKIFMYKLISFAIFEFLFGFLIWNLDTFYCFSLIRFRRFIDLPFGILIEFHGWWHILTGLGIFHFIIYNQLLNIYFKGLENKYELIWKYGIPYEVRLIKDKEE
ncbi:hypothetical protein CANARDRAFT_174583 [[Candida] arabinofermentans NRRL YB-2248]|uniref:Alkaline ceramidase n=1 Tax=[Candida] arabinofermentans NRRL YB-2248 TaxID=983967 RepID=A0A1E4T708_9ASCO|nr:hypothetical protein CANARDRAFT_174583 [[Candida] arabinofermentans NRRL YB-2248]